MAAYYTNTFTVNAWIIDSNGTFSYLSGYPKAFQSKHYNNDVAKTLQRARGDFHTVIGTLCARDDRKVQTVTLHDLYGNEMEPPFTIGQVEVEESTEPET